MNSAPAITTIAGALLFVDASRLAGGPRAALA
jgi:hypothetical protein